jgi:hypothetical protein
MGCTASKPLPSSSDPPSQTPLDESSTSAQPIAVEPTQPPSSALLLLAMEATVIEAEEDHVRHDSRNDQVPDRSSAAGLDGINASPTKSRLHPSILSDQQPEDAVEISMLPDVSYSMRGSPGQVASQHPIVELNQPPNAKSSGRNGGGVQGAAQMPPRPGPSAGGSQMPVLVPLQQPQIARGPGWMSGPPPRGRGGPIPAGAPIPRGSLPATRGRGRPVHVMVPGDRSMTHGGPRQPFPVVGNPPSPENAKSNTRVGVEQTVGSSSSEAEEDDEDLEDDDEAVEDWDLGDEETVVLVAPTTSVPASSSPSRAKGGASHSNSPTQAPAVAAAAASPAPRC